MEGKDEEKGVRVRSRKTLGRKKRARRKKREKRKETEVEGRRKEENKGNGSKR